MKRSLRSMLPLFLVALLAAPTQADENWPQWRGPNRDGKSPVTGLDWNWEKSEPKLDFISDGMGRGYAGVAIVNGRLYTTGNFENGQALVCVNAADGSPIWKTPLTEKPPKHGYPGSRSTPSVDDGHVYAVTSDGQIVCLDAQDGQLKWKRNFRQDWNGKMMSGWGFSESPLVDGPWVLCTPGAKEAMIVALDKQTGKEVWRAAVPDFAAGANKKSGAAYSSMVISEGGGVKQYVQLVGGGVISVRARDGNFLWGYADVANRTANIPSPVVAGDIVFCSTGYGAGAALLKIQENGNEIQEKYFLEAKTLQNHHGGMILHNGFIYCGHRHNSGFPICVELETGEVAWGGDIRGPGKGSAAVVFVDGHLIFRYQSGHVAAIEASPDEYRMKGVFMPEHQEGNSWAHPVVVGDRLYLREQDKLMCYRLKSGADE